MLRVVIFDLDGTLIDSTEAIVNSYLHLFDVLEKTPPTRKAIVDAIGYTMHTTLEMLGCEDVDAAGKIYRKHYNETTCDHTFLLPGARECLEALSAAGLKVGFATSKKRTSAEMLLEHLGVLDFFSCRLGPEDVTHPKPHPEAIEKALAALDVTKEEAYYVGDMFFDVEASQRADVPCVCVTTGYQNREELEALKPEAVMDSLTEVADYLLERCPDAPCAVHG